MAFNLNKNDGPARSDPSRVSKFDLSKNEGPGMSQIGKKINFWIWALPVLLLVGAGAWYFKSLTSVSGTPVAGESSVATKPEMGKAVADTAKEKRTAEADSSALYKQSRPLASKPSKQADTLAAKVSGSGIPADKVSSNRVAASFRSGSSAIAKVSHAAVTQLLALSKHNALINVNGYASSEGNLAFNQKISQARADVFKRYLVSKGLSENSIIAAGKGVGDPVAPNDTEAGRKKNRRVEIVIQQAAILIEK